MTVPEPDSDPNPPKGSDGHLPRVVFACVRNGGR